MKSRAAANYFPCDSLRSPFRRKRARESVYIKVCVACTAGVHGAGQRPWERPDPRQRPESLVTAAPAGMHQHEREEAQSSFNHILPYFCIPLHPSSLALPLLPL